MKYGFFDDRNKEYVISTPFTPLPWINYLGNEQFFGLISNTGGGYCFYRDAKLMRLLRYRYNNIPADIGGRFYYIKEQNKPAWSPAYHPCDVELDSYRCRHGLGYTVFESSKDALSVALTCFVPMGENCEVHKLTLKNESVDEKNIRLTGAVEWCLWNTVDDSTNFQRNLNIAEVEVEGSTIYHKTEYRERRNHYAYYGVNAPICGYDTRRDSFLGPMGDWRNPQAIREASPKNSQAHSWSPIAALNVDVLLAPGEEKTYVFVLGYGENPRDQKFIAPGVIRKDGAHATLARFVDAARVDDALAELARYWEELLGIYQVESPDENVNRMVNIWNQYQCMVTFNMSRSASYFESGTGRGMGFRDSCQDLLGFVHMIPERARERIIDIASIQWESGASYHQYQPLTKRGNSDIGSGFNDDPLWLVACTYAYIAETGDTTILDHPTPFDNVPGSEKPLMEHLRRSVNYTLNNLGPHGLPLIGRADWNDCLNLNCFSREPGESFQTSGPSEGPVAESVFIAGMFVKYARQYAQLCRLIGLNEEADQMLAAADQMEETILLHGWDGEWFLRAYDAYGRKIGSKECEEGKIFIEPQGFCVMAGVGVKDGQARKALDSVRKHLLGQYGVELLTPCYTVYHEELGEITSYPPGYKENGSIFCHNNPWVSIAEAELGNGDNAFDLFRRICPAYQEEISDIRRCEPYCYAQTVASRPSYNEGEAKNSWLTGTAAWTFVNISQYILGIQPTLNGLSVKPCLPSHMDGFTALRKYRGTEYRITVRRTGKNVMKVDGVPVEGNVVPMAENKKCCQVEIEIA
ncbi:MAG: glycosyl transferase [Clostridiales bacterium]|nr:glycosyl transferase [Clostridiales bacterium]